MRVSPKFREFVLDQLAGVEHLRTRDMFGGVGLYAEEVFFGILASDVLYFKVDETNRREFEMSGSVPFKPYADRPMSMSYYNVPVEVLEDADTLCLWAARAVSVARATKPSRRAKRKRGKAR